MSCTLAGGEHLPKPRVQTGNYLHDWSAGMLMKELYTAFWPSTPQQKHGVSGERC